MSALNKILFLGAGIFFLWLTLSIPNIPQLFTIDISGLTQDQRVLLQYSSLVMYMASMFGMAFEGEI